MTGFLTVISISLVSLASQLNLKYVSSKLFIDAKFEFPVDKLYFLSLVLRAAIPSIISLMLTIYGYSRFPFFQFMIFQTLYFVFAIVADKFIFGGELTFRSILAAFFILIGIALANI